MEPKIVYREDIDKVLDYCKDPNCAGGHLSERKVLTQTCHPGEGLDLRYLDGVLYATCVDCHKTILKIKVAKRE